MQVRRHLSTIGKLLIESLLGYLTFALLDSVRTFIPSIFTKNPLSNTETLYGILGIIAIVGATILAYHLFSRLYNYLKNEKKPIDTKTEARPRRGQILYKRKTAEDKVDDLIQEIESFRKKWGDPTFLKRSYRRDIEDQSMWENRGKIREHSKEITKRIRPLRSLQIADLKIILDTLDETTDRMIDLGLDVEGTFKTLKTIEESLKSEPNRINRLLQEGDSIDKELGDIISRLEKLRRYLP